MRFLRNGFEKLYKVKFLKSLHPMIKATEAFFFSPSNTTKKAPFIRDFMDVKRYMSTVILFLLPLVFAGVYFNGLKVLMMILVSYVAGGITEILFAIYRKKEVEEGFFVTGMIFPLVLPVTTPLWAVALGIIFGVIFGKEVFGGTGRNIFNPALVGRLFLTFAFPLIMSTYSPPFTEGFAGLVQYKIDVITSATPLTVFKNSGQTVSYMGLLFGKHGGSIGETMRVLVAGCGLLLIFTKVANWRLPLFSLASLILFSFIGNYFFPTKIAPPIFQLLSGGLLFGIFFMATDPVTSPFTRQGKVISGILMGILILLFRSFSGYTEGVMFSIILINAFSQLIDEIVLSVKYKKKKHLMREVEK